MPDRPTHFEIPVDDPDRAEKFYAEVFGWKFDRYPGAPGALELRCGVERRALRHEPRTLPVREVADPVQVQRDRAPPPPVVGQDGAEPSQPDRFGLVAVPNLERRRQVDGVLGVLLVQ